MCVFQKQIASNAAFADRTQRRMRTALPTMHRANPGPEHVPAVQSAQRLPAASHRRLRHVRESSVSRVLLPGQHGHAGAAGHAGRHQRHAALQRLLHCVQHGRIVRQ